MSRPGVDLMRSKKVNLKSSAVIRSPLWNTTSSRSSIGIVRPSADSSQRVIRCGTSLRLGSWSSGWSNTALNSDCASGVKRWLGSQPGTSLGQAIVTASSAARTIAGAASVAAVMREKAAASCCERHESPLVIAAKLAVATEADNTARPSPSSRAVTLTRDSGGSSLRPESTPRSDPHRGGPARRAAAASRRTPVRGCGAARCSPAPRRVRRRSRAIPAYRPDMRHRVRAADTAPSRRPCSAAAPVCRAAACGIRASGSCRQHRRRACKCRDRS